MKAISVKQPWANLIASGSKTIETRTWMTKYRGPLLIVSSKKPSIYPAGCAVALVDLVDCRVMESDDVDNAYCPIYPKAKAWVLENIRRVKPILVKGALSVFECGLEENDLEILE